MDLQDFFSLNFRKLCNPISIKRSLVNKADEGVVNQRRRHMVRNPSPTKLQLFLQMQPWVPI